MSDLIASKDWAATPIGPRSYWPQRLKFLVETVLDQPAALVVMWGPQLTQIYNDAYRILISVKHPAALGQSAYDCWPETAEMSGPIYDRVLQGDSIQVEDQRLSLSRGGQTQDVAVTISYSPVLDDDGKIAGILAVFFETKVNSRIADAGATDEPDPRQLSEQRRLALEAAQSGWWQLDLVNGKLIWDKRLRDMLGVPDGDIDYEMVSRILHPDDRARIEDAVLQALDPNNTKPYVAEYRFYHSNGSLRWLRSTGRALFEGEGSSRQVVSFFGTAEDVTGVKQAEASLRENAERLSLAMEAAELGDWEWDSRTDLMTLSSRAADVFGIPANQPITREQMRNLIHENFRAVAKAAAERAAAERGDYDIEYLVNRPDGKQVWVSAKGRSIYDETGALIRTLGVVQDITRRKTGEQEREQLLAAERAARAEAERANRMKDEFLTTLSHELRTPLNAIVGWSQILRRGASGNDLTEGLEIIERNARAQTQIIEDLLDMSRIVSGKIRLDVQRLDLADIIKAGVETVRPAAEGKGLRLVAVLDPVAGPVLGDSNRLHQVIWNLLSNAVKFTGKGGRIQVALERVNSHVEIGVTDTGMGISPDFLPYVFDRFRQADSSTTRRHGGLGLGLAIVKQLVELHGGTIHVKSPGLEKGSTFTVNLPIAAVHPEPAVQNAVSRRHPERGSTSEHYRESSTSLAGVRVLAVDDEADARALIRRILTECEAIVQTAGSVSEGLELLRTNQFDVLVSDIGMPGQDGFEFITEVRTLPSEQGGRIPALALSAYARSEDRMRAVRAGFQMHLAKPVDPAEFVTMVASLAKK